MFAVLARRGSRASGVAVALALGLLISAPGALARSHKPAPKRHGSLVSCSYGFCTTYFKVDVKGTQSTYWNWPYHLTGGGSCWSTPYKSGTGSQDVTFQAKGIVELETYHGRILAFDFLARNGRPEGGLGAGSFSVTQKGQIMLDVKPGPCGSLHNPGGGNLTSGCGTYRESVIALLTYVDPRHVKLSLAADPQALPGLTPPLSGECAPLATGIPGWNEAGLYDGFTEDMPLADLMSPKYGKMILVAKHSFATQDPPPYTDNVPFTGVTDVDWTLDMLRIRHKPFPVAAGVD